MNWSAKHQNRQPAITGSRWSLPCGVCGGATGLGNMPALVKFRPKPRKTTIAATRIVREIGRQTLATRRTGKVTAHRSQHRHIPRTAQLPGAVGRVGSLGNTPLSYKGGRLRRAERRSDPRVAETEVCIGRRCRVGVWTLDGNLAPGPRPPPTAVVAPSA